MRFIKKWRFVLIVGIAAIAIPIAAGDSPTVPAFVTEPQAVYQQPVAENAVATVDPGKDIKIAAGHRVTPPQDYYDRRREYWEDRMERRADDLEEEDGNDDDSADSEDKNDSASADDKEEGSMDEEEELIERRREYWRERLDREW